MKTLAVEPAEPEVGLRKFTIAEYYRMAEAGILAWKERVELLDGCILKMAPIGDRHENILDTLIGIFGDQRKSRYVIRANGPIRIPDFSEPQPDLTLYRPGVRTHPTPENIHLVIEVSETTLRYDTGKKKQVYERGGIREYWVVDGRQKAVLVHEPKGDRFQVTAHTRGAIAPREFPDVIVNLDNLF
ncbi:MAG: Uma2 family endonuclease [Verrucomicrobia bacterium]|nr:Uma2 family endonuclease [Verrucomicrobiota bacterium]